MTSSETHRRPESAVVATLKKRLRQVHPKVAVEVPFLSRYLDIVLETADGEIHAIEVKCHGWKRGIRQAQDSTLGAHRAFLAILSEEVRDDLVEAVRRAGIGLILLSKGGVALRIVETPPISSDRWAPATELLRQRLGQLQEP